MALEKGRNLFKQLSEPLVSKLEGVNPATLTFDGILGELRSELADVLANIDRTTDVEELYQLKDRRAVLLDFIASMGADDVAMALDSSSSSWSSDDGGNCGLLWGEHTAASIAAMDTTSGATLNDDDTTTTTAAGGCCECEACAEMQNIMDDDNMMCDDCIAADMPDLCRWDEGLLFQIALNMIFNF